MSLETSSMYLHTVTAPSSCHIFLFGSVLWVSVYLLVGSLLPWTVSCARDGTWSDLYSPCVCAWHMMDTRPYLWKEEGKNAWTEKCISDQRLVLGGTFQYCRNYKIKTKGALCAYYYRVKGTPRLSLWHLCSDLCLFFLFVLWCWTPQLWRQWRQGYRMAYSMRSHTDPTSRDPLYLRPCYVLWKTFLI